MATQPTHIVVLGGGFAGVYSAIYLEKMLSRAEKANVKITIVSRENYIVFQPLLPEIISGAIEILHVISPIRRLTRHSQLLTREIESIDLENKTVTLAPGFRPKPTTLTYDHLVIGLGTVLDYSKVAGMREHAIEFKYLGDALRLRNHLVHVLEEADNEPDPAERQRLLTFVVAGGGFSGVECIAEMNDFLRGAVRVYRNIKTSDIRMILLQSADRILPEMKPDLALFAQKILTSRGVEIRLNTRLRAVTANEAIMLVKGTENAEIIPTRTTVVTVPSGPHPLVATLNCPREKGDRIKVNAFMEVAERPGLWALGDCAAAPQPDGIFSPPTAQHAIRQAKTLATNIVASIRGTQKKPFTFTGLGKLGSLGRGAAVAEIMGIRFSGFLAWMVWRAVYLSKLPGLDRKIRVFADWFHDLFLPRDVTQVRIFQNEAVSNEHYEPGEIIFDAGDFGDKVYFIVKGQADVVLNGKVLVTLSKGEVFGEIALISDCPRSASVIAKTALDVVVVSRAAFKKLFAHLPGVRDAMEDIVHQRTGGAVTLEGKLDHS